ncbi:MAG: hypothetical protein QQN63_13235 [Nitrosopumilus sp.]
MLITLTNDQKAQLVGWLHREKDHSLSIVAMSERVIIPRATGTLELIRNDYEWILRVKDAIRESGNESVDLSNDDIETLILVARSNNYADRREFWKGIISAIGEDYLT